MGLVNSFLELKEYNLHEEGDRTIFTTNLEDDLSLVEPKVTKTKKSLSSYSKSGLRWKQIDTLARDTICYLFLESLNSYWSFQWCPHQQTMYQGRRQPNGILQRQYNLGSGRHLPIIEGVQEKENRNI